jgi:coenzyme F420-dependent glucose-6-phosphate dehydrogenase
MLTPMALHATLPDELPPIMVAASGPQAAASAGRIGDGLIAVEPQQQTLERFDSSGGAGKPRYGQVTVCWAPDEAQAIKTAHAWWPNTALKGEMSQELPTPAHFEQAAQMVKPEDVAQSIICGPDPQKHIAAIQKYVDAGFDHVYVHQVGPDQEGFFQFYQREVLPNFR